MRYQTEVAVYDSQDGNSYIRRFRMQDYVETGTINKAFEHGITKAMEEFAKQNPEVLEKEK